MTLRRLKLGQAGESAAAQYLKACGYTLVETNYRTRAFEIDIIARENQTLCFIEVKTRSGLKRGRPAEAVHLAKQQKIIAGASHYLKKHGLSRTQVRFDVVEVLYTDAAPQIRLIRHAFYGS